MAEIAYDTKDKVNMRSLASELGLSPMTISRALNGSSKVKAETRSMVLTKVRELGYDSDAKLRKAKGEKARNVAIHCGAEKLSSSIPFDFYPQLYYHCIHKLKALGLRGHLIDLNAGSPSDAEVLSNCGALIALSKVKPEAWAKTASQEGLKVLDVMGEIEGLATVSPDEVGGGELAARHIASKGHLRCACFAELSERGFRQRYAGFLAYMQGLPQKVQVDLIRFEEARSQKESDALKEAALDKYLDACGKEMPTAFFVPGGYSARILYLHLRKRGLSMPKDFSLVGYDDLDYLKDLEQNVTRVFFDVRELAVKAAETMAGIIESKSSIAYKTLVPVALIDEGSCGQAPERENSGREP